MRSINDALANCWRLYDRGIITRAEIMNQFWGEIIHSNADAVEIFRGLPERSQSLIEEYLQRVPPEAMPPLLYLGDVTEAQICEELAIRQAKAIAIAAYIASAT